MSFLTDLRSVSENVLEQVADRFSDLPRPLLAAIGAGDMAVERLAELRESIQVQLPNLSTSRLSDVRGAAGDMPARAQKAAGDVAGSLQRLAAEAPDKARELIEELPGKVTEFSSTLSPDMLRETVEAYTQLAGLIYGNLANRGDRTWSKVRGGGLVPGTVVPPASDRQVRKTADPGPADPRPSTSPRSTSSTARATPASRTAKASAARTAPSAGAGPRVAPTETAAAKAAVRTAGRTAKPSVAKTSAADPATGRTAAGRARTAAESVTGPRRRTSTGPSGQA